MSSGFIFLLFVRIDFFVKNGMHILSLLLRNGNAIHFNFNFNEYSKRRNPIERDRREEQNRARIFKLIRSPRIDSKESIPPAYVDRRAGSTTLFLIGS